MIGLLKRYTRWLHTGWPAGTVEKLPLVREDGSTNVAGLYVVGDLTGIPLLKFSADTGARAVQTILADGSFKSEQSSRGEDVYDLVIVGGGVSGMAAALEAKKAGLRYVLLEASQAFSTIVNFPKGKPIYTYPTEMVPAGDIRFEAQVKEPLIEELLAQTVEQGLELKEARATEVVRKGGRLKVGLPEGEPPLVALRVIVAIGRSGNFRKLGVPGEELDKVSNRLHDPKDYGGQNVLIVGGGDSALEAAISLVQCGAHVHLSYRKPEFSRPKPDNVQKLMALAEDPLADVAVEQPSSERVTTSTGRFVKDAVTKAGHGPGSLTLHLPSEVKEIGASEVTLTSEEGETRIDNDAVFAMIGREAPLDFFRRSGVKIRGEWTKPGIAGFVAFMAAMFLLYAWKTNGAPLYPGSEDFPKTVPKLISSLGAGYAAAVDDRTTVLGTLAMSMKSPSFYYTLAYCILVFAFGVQRIRRRKTPYVTLQTTVLFLIQLIPLFLLPELILPLLGYNGFFNEGAALSGIANELFPLYVKSDAIWPSWGHPRAYWHAYGLVLAWPLNVWNIFTSQPMWGWLGIGVFQTFVIIPLLVWRYGKGAYCGWICSCGALAETLGDAHRHKMPHGPFWNRLNMVGQVILGFAFLLLFMRIAGWIWPDGYAARYFPVLFSGTEAGGGKGFVNPLSYKWIVDVLLAGVVGIGFYFWYSGRVWCRFACPLAALMHIYARFSQFRILADKKKCISCNVCTSVCHQGIDVMNFANKGLPMEDPECVRCSACVQSCPTGVLVFGRVDRAGNELARDPLPASPVRMREGKKLPVV